MGVGECGPATPDPVATWGHRLTGHLVRDLSPVELGCFLAEVNEAAGAGDELAAAILPAAQALRELAVARRAEQDDATALAALTYQLELLRAGLLTQLERDTAALLERELRRQRPIPPIPPPPTERPPVPRVVEEDTPPLPRRRPWRRRP